MKHPTIHLICGFIGFGKTTLAKMLENKLSALRFTHDEYMLKQYGRNPDDFAAKYKLVDDYIREQVTVAIKHGQDVIMDYGFWNHNIRQEYYSWAKGLTDNVIFHLLQCDIKMAKERVLKRLQDDKTALFIDENIFDILLKQYEDWSYADKYPVVLYNSKTEEYIDKIVAVEIDRKKGDKHPKYGHEYPLNYGYIPYTISGDDEEIDAYVLGVDKPIDQFIGRCIGLVRRHNDNDDKLIVVPDGIDFSEAEIEARISFQEKWFQHILIRHK